VYPRLKNETRTQTRFCVGRVQVTGAKMHPNPHLSGVKLMSYLKPEPELPSLYVRHTTAAVTLSRRTDRAQILPWLQMPLEAPNTGWSQKSTCFSPSARSTRRPPVALSLFAGSALAAFAAIQLAGSWVSGQVDGEP
jgi:hypothetical protein